MKLVYLEEREDEKKNLVFSIGEDFFVPQRNYVNDFTIYLQSIDVSHEKKKN